MEDLKEESFQDIDAHRVANVLSHVFVGTHFVESRVVHSLKAKHFVDCHASVLFGEPMSPMSTARNTWRVVENFSGTG